jgi:Tfp pilus assembly protein PilN
MRIINLLPKEELHNLKVESMSNQTLRFWLSVIAVLVLVFGISLGAKFYLTQKIASSEASIAEKKASLSTASIKKLEQEVLALNQQVNLIQTLRADHYNWSRALIEVAQLSNGGITLTSLQMDRVTGKVTVQGEASDRDNVLQFWNAVRSSYLFTDIDFPLTNLEKDAGANFSFNFFVKPEELKKE